MMGGGGVEGGRIMAGLEWGGMGRGAGLGGNMAWRVNMCV